MNAMKQVTIDCAGLDKAGVMAALAHALAFPDWFGGNFDALFECLTEEDEAVTLALQHWRAARLSARDRTGFAAVFEDAMEELGPERFLVTYAESTTTVSGSDTKH